MPIYKKLNQHGIAHLALIIVLVLVTGGVSFAAGNVYNAQKKKQDAARVAADEKLKTDLAAVLQKKEAEIKTVEIPAAEAEKKIEPTPTTAPKPTTTTTKTQAQPTYTKFDISSASAQVNADNVVVAADLGKIVSGVCAVSVYGVSQTATFYGGKTSLWYEVNFSNKSNCSVTVPREKLTGTGTYKFQMYYVDNYSNKTLKGTSAYYNFDL